ncbi:MAG: DUF120 domain-containing protein [Candidatus Micrarchaeota archaeon]
MRPTKLTLIIDIAKRGGMENSIGITSGEIASGLGISQQTASRWLASLSSEGLIDRKSRKAALTGKGIAMLESTGKEIGELFSKRERILQLLGRVVSGMHEGRYYLSIPEYKKQISQATGFDAFPGTLNLRLEGAASIDGKRRLMSLTGIDIKGFRKNGRKLGGAKLFKAKISHRNSIEEGAAIVPAKSHYGSEILELISPHNLRARLKLKNNDEVGVVIGQE